MTPERFELIEEVYHRALRLEESQRAAFLHDACAGDDALQREVESLLGAHENAEHFMTEPASRMTLKAGSYLGSYEILAVVGAGGMGEVYRAWDSKLKREVAIKVLPDEFCRSPERISRFQREAEILASLNHPHIATIYDIAQSEDVRFLILEFVGGETLAERFARGPLPIREALALAKQIAEALEAAHQKGIIHRDLKPANIKVGSDGTVKVLDFGLAKTITIQAASVDLSQSPTVTTTGAEDGVMMGTPAYMSPEQARGQRLDRRTDIWSFGCVLYEALTGRSAFAEKTLPDTIARILGREPISIRQLRRDVPPDVERLVMRCLEKDADARYPSATELLSEIAKCEKRLASRAKALITALKRPAVAISIVAILIAAAIATWFWMKRAEQVRSARNERIPQIEMYAEAGDWEAAYGVAKKVQEVIPNDPALAGMKRLLMRASLARNFRRFITGASPWASHWVMARGSCPQAIWMRTVRRQLGSSRGSPGPALTT